MLNLNEIKPGDCFDVRVKNLESPYKAKLEVYLDNRELFSGVINSNHKKVCVNDVFDLGLKELTVRVWDLSDDPSYDFSEKKIRVNVYSKPIVYDIKVCFNGKCGLFFQAPSDGFLLKFKTKYAKRVYISFNGKEKEVKDNEIFLKGFGVLKITAENEYGKTILTYGNITPLSFDYPLKPKEGSKRKYSGAFVRIKLASRKAILVSTSLFASAYLAFLLSNYLRRIILTTGIRAGRDFWRGNLVKIRGNEVELTDLGIKYANRIKKRVSLLEIFKRFGKGVTELFNSFRTKIFPFEYTEFEYQDLYAKFGREFVDKLVQKYGKRAIYVLRKVEDKDFAEYVLKNNLDSYDLKALYQIYQLVPKKYYKIAIRIFNLTGRKDFISFLYKFGLLDKLASFNENEIRNALALYDSGALLSSYAKFGLVGLRKGILDRRTLRIIEEVRREIKRYIRKAYKDKYGEILEVKDKDSNYYLPILTGAGRERFKDVLDYLERVRKDIDSYIQKEVPVWSAIKWIPGVRALYSWLKKRKSENINGDLIEMFEKGILESEARTQSIRDYIEKLEEERLLGSLFRLREIVGNLYTGIYESRNKFERESRNIQAGLDLASGVACGAALAATLASSGAATPALTACGITTAASATWRGLRLANTKNPFLLEEELPYFVLDVANVITTTIEIDFWSKYLEIRKLLGKEKADYLTKKIKDVNVVYKAVKNEKVVKTLREVDVIKAFEGLAPEELEFAIRLIKAKPEWLGIFAYNPKRVSEFYKAMQKTGAESLDIWILIMNRIEKIGHKRFFTEFMRREQTQYEFKNLLQDLKIGKVCDLDEIRYTTRSPKEFEITDWLYVGHELKDYRIEVDEVLETSEGRVLIENTRTFVLDKLSELLGENGETKVDRIIAFMKENDIRYYILRTDRPQEVPLDKIKQLANKFEQENIGFYFVITRRKLWPRKM